MNSPDYAIHYGTTYAPNPHEIDGDKVKRKRRIGEIMDAIDEHLFSEVIDDSWEFADKVVAILNDRDDDKLGRIQDLHYSKKMTFAEWLIDAGNSTVTIPLKRKLGLDW